MAQTIFIGGVHGVGKTTLCNSITEFVDITYHSASSLIAKQRQASFDTKLVSNVGSNQDILITALNNNVEDDEPILLDGHFCLLNKEFEIVKVPFGTFKNLNLKANILMIEDPHTIYERLSTRDNKNYSVTLLNEFQEQEKKYFEEVSQKLNIESFICTNKTTIKEVTNFIKKHIAQ